MRSRNLDSMNIIDTLYCQTYTVLELLATAAGEVSIRTVNVSAEMCISMLDEIKAEVDKIYDTIKAHDDDLKQLKRLRNKIEFNF